MPHIPLLLLFLPAVALYCRLNRGSGSLGTMQCGSYAPELVLIAHQSNQVSLTPCLLAGKEQFLVEFS